MSDADLLTLVQWLSPAFPVGGYAYSHGLEAAIASGQITHSEDVLAWLDIVLSHGSGRQDATLLAAAMAPAADLDRLTAIARALAPSAERHREAEEQGAAFARTVAALLGADMPPRPLAVAVGAAARHLDLPPPRVASHYLQAFASNLVSCAVRAVPLGQTEGQRVLASLTPLCHAIATDAADTPLDSIGSAAFGSDLASLAHEAHHVRLYRS